MQILPKRKPEIAEKQKVSYSFCMKVYQYILLIILLAGCGCFVAAGFGKISKFFSGGKVWKKKLDALPVLKTDEEILKALHGEPKDYLVENYAFNNGTTVRDTALNVLDGEYLFIGITKETYTVNDAYIRRYRNAVWQGEPYQNLAGTLQLANGVQLEMPENASFQFSLLDESLLKKSDLKPHDQENYFQARYYPDGVYKIDTQKLGENFKKNVLKNTQQFNSRYKFQFMKKGDTATFAARIGGGKASLNVFQEHNVIAVRGGKKALAKYLNRMSQPEKLPDNYIMDYVVLGIWILCMIPAFSIAVLCLVTLLASLLGK